MTLVVAVARSWLGTPYVHQASVKGAGTDCLGLIRGIWREVFGAEPEAVPAYTPDWSEPQHAEVLWAAAMRHMSPVGLDEPFALGECLLFRMRDDAVAKHLGVVSSVGEHPAFIHAYSGRGVVESTLSRPWGRRIAARFRFPADAGAEE